MAILAICWPRHVGMCGSEVVVQPEPIMIIIHVCLDQCLYLIVPFNGSCGAALLFLELLAESRNKSKQQSRAVCISSKKRLALNHFRCKAPIYKVFIRIITVTEKKSG